MLYVSAPCISYCVLRGYAPCLPQQKSFFKNNEEYIFVQKSYVLFLDVGDKFCPVTAAPMHPFEGVAPVTGPSEIGVETTKGAVSEAVVGSSSSSGISFDVVGRADDVVGLNGAWGRDDAAAATAAEASASTWVQSTSSFNLNFIVFLFELFSSRFYF